MAGQEGTGEDRAPMKTRLVMALDHESATGGGWRTIMSGMEEG